MRRRGRLADGRLADRQGCTRQSVADAARGLRRRLCASRPPTLAVADEAGVMARHFLRHWRRRRGCALPQAAAVALLRRGVETRGRVVTAAGGRLLHAKDTQKKEIFTRRLGRAEKAGDDYVGGGDLDSRFVKR